MRLLWILLLVGCTTTPPAATPGIWAERCWQMSNGESPEYGTCLRSYTVLHTAP
jgi:hypothetical protein